MDNLSPCEESFDDAVRLNEPIISQQVEGRMDSARKPMSRLSAGVGPGTRVHGSHAASVVRQAEIPPAPEELRPAMVPLTELNEGSTGPVQSPVDDNDELYGDDFAGGEASPDCGPRYDESLPSGGVVRRRRRSIMEGDELTADKKDEAMAMVSEGLGYQETSSSR